MKKKVLSILLALVMVLGMFPATAFASSAFNVGALSFAGVPTPIAGQTVDEYLEMMGSTLTINGYA